MFRLGWFRTRRAAVDPPKRDKSGSTFFGLEVMGTGLQVFNARGMSGIAEIMRGIRGKRSFFTNTSFVSPNEAAQN